MPPPFAFDKVRVQLGVSDPERRQALRRDFYNLGCQDVRFAGSVSELDTALTEHPPDLLVVDVTLDPAVIGLFRAIRHGEVGTNPFLPLVAVVDHPTHDTVHRVVDSGADDLFPHPWEVGFLEKRLIRLIHDRRPFVVTADYTGPDRRNTRRSGEAAVERLVVPNALRAKALERQPETALARDIAAGITMLDTRKIGRLAELVARLVTELERHGAADGGPAPLAVACLDKMMAALEAILKRIHGSPFAPVAPTCRTLKEAAEHLYRAAERGQVPDLEALRGPAARFVTAFNVDPKAARAGLPAHLRARLPHLRLREDVA